MLSEHGGKRLRAGAAAGKAGGVEPIGHLDGNPDRRAVALPLRPYDDVGGDDPLLLVQGDTTLVGGGGDRFAEVIGRLVYGALNDAG